jgi:hypothetical protein
MQKVLSLQNLAGAYLDPCAWSSMSCESYTSCVSGVSSVTEEEQVS